MSIARLLTVVCLALGSASSAMAQVSCADPNNLCTGDPCETTNITVQVPCVVDFGNRTLVIGGALTVPPGTLHFTASTILVQGRIEAPGTSVTLTANMGLADLNTEIDVGTADLTVTATGTIDVKTRLKARGGGGSVTLHAGGALTTMSTAVIETEPSGSLDLRGDGGVTIGGKIFGGDGGTVFIESSAGLVTLNQDVRADGPAPSSITVNGAAGVAVNTAVFATKSVPPSSIVLTSSGGNIDLLGKVSVAGDDGGTIDVEAPTGTIGPLGVDAKGKFNGGSVTMTGATIDLFGKITAKGATNGGSVQLQGSTLVRLNGSDIEVTGKANAGSISLLGDPGSGDVVLAKAGIKAAGGSGAGGTIVVSTPGGAVDLRAKINATTKAGPPGSITVDGASLSVGPKALLDVDAHGPGGEIRFNQSGAGLFNLNATCEARDDGVIEAKAPTGSLTVVGHYRAEPAGCIGFSAGGTLDTSSATTDVPVTASCP